MRESLSFSLEEGKFYASLPKTLQNEEIIDALLILGFSNAGEKKFSINFDKMGLPEQNKLILNLKSYLEDKNYSCDWDEDSKLILDSIEETKKNLESVKSIAESLIGKKVFKDEELFSPDFKRELKGFQKESVSHLLNLPFAANFSVPGSGKTTLVYAAYSKLKEIGEIDKLLIVGPSPIYLAWQEEFYQCFGKYPKLTRIIGDLSKRKIIYEKEEESEIFIVTYQMLANDVLQIQELLKKHNFLVVLDESHYIKSFKEGKWASTVLEIAPYSKRKIILTGTPVPNNLFDLWSQFTFLDPTESLLGGRNKYKKIV
ncbi:MAG: SNF2-related protein, partial [Patescibacteria group bacterium]